MRSSVRTVIATALGVLAFIFLIDAVYLFMNTAVSGSVIELLLGLSMALSFIDIPLANEGRIIATLMFAASTLSMIYYTTTSGFLMVDTIFWILLIATMIMGAYKLSVSKNKGGIVMGAIIGVALALVSPALGLPIPGILGYSLSSVPVHSLSSVISQLSTLIAPFIKQFSTGQRVHTVSFTKGPLILNPGQYTYVALNVTQSMVNATLDVVVESTSPVYAYLMTQQQFNTFKSSTEGVGLVVTPFTYAAYGTRATIKYPLSAGTYYILVMNRDTSPTTVLITGNITYIPNPQQ